MSSLNELIARSRGRYLALMNADDISLPEQFSKEVRFLDAHSDCGAVGGFHELINGASERIGIVRHPLSHEEIDELHLKGFCSISNPSAMLRRSVIVELNGYNPEFDAADDLELWLRMAERAKVANIPEVLIQYRLHDFAISERLGAEQRRRAELACSMAWARRGIPGRFEALESWRPSKDKASQHKFALKYGWMAWNHNHRATWWTYACKAFWLKPFAVSTWRLVIFGFFKRPCPPVRHDGH